MNENGIDGKNGFNGRTLKSVVGMIIVAVLYWPVAYIKEGHDAVIRLEAKNESFEARLAPLEAEKNRIAGLAAERGKELQRIDRDLIDISMRLTAIEREQARRTPYIPRKPQ